MKKLIAKAMIFLLIMMTICFCFNEVLVQKWSYEEDNAAMQIATGFYEEPQNSLDVLYFGLSSMRNGISPLTIWNSYGITSYSRASSIQSPLLSYYLLEEALKTQSPKVIIVEGSPLVQSLAASVNDYDTNEGKVHEAIDYMKFSEVKLKAAKEIAAKSELSVAELLIPLYRYHDRWQNLGKEDFTSIFEEKRYAYKGNYPAVTKTNLKLPENYMEMNAGIVEYLSEESAFYIDKIAGLCKENNIDLILLCMPTLSSNYAKNKVIQEYADAIGVKYIDLNLPELQEEMGFSINNSFIDSGSHLNILGSNVVSEYIGKYLSENYHFTDKREDEDFAAWNEDYALYCCEMENYFITSTNSFFTTIDYCDKDRYLIILAGKYDISEHFNEDVYEALQKLGLNVNMKDYPYNEYLAVIDGKEVVIEQTSEEVLNYSYKISGKSVQIHSESSRIDVGSASIIIDGKEYAPNSVGINFVIYDKVLERVIKSAVYNTGKTGVEYIRSEKTGGKT